MQLTKHDREYLALLWRTDAFPELYTWLDVYPASVVLNMDMTHNKARALRIYYHSVLMKHFPLR